MAVTIKINARNDLHLPANILQHLNLGQDRIVKVEIKGNTLVVIPVDLEPRYTHEELRGLDHLHEAEKKKGWIPIKSDKDIDNLTK